MTGGRKTVGKKEGKFLMVDCFTSWCAPCKKMEKEVYPLQAVGDHMRNDFVAIKVQLDTTKSDDEYTTGWYSEANAITSKYQVEVYPTYLFFNPEGKLVHRAVGFQQEDMFLATLNRARDAEHQIYTLLGTFDEGKLDLSLMPELVKSLKDIGERQKAYEVANVYIEKYLLKLDKDELYKEANIGFIGSNVRTSNSPAFAIFIKNSFEADSVTYAGFSRDVVEHMIVRENIMPAVERWKQTGTVKVKRQEWARINQVVQDKYGRAYADRTVLKQQIAWCKANAQWQDVVQYNVRLIEEFGLDTAGNGALYTNNTIYNTIFVHTDDRTTLKKCARWMKIICDAHPEDGGIWTHMQISFTSWGIRRVQFNMSKRHLLSIQVTRR
ncbi:thioredoxin family protein [Puia sp. P3]|uniref:thioredoxin family protein n=1 Tax=Puia sp. P3 TaxID=3423952 RepID=UPI003D66D7F2